MRDLWFFACPDMSITSISLTSRGKEDLVKGWADLEERAREMCLKAEDLMPNLPVM